MLSWTIKLERVEDTAIVLGGSVCLRHLEISRSPWVQWLTVYSLTPSVHLFINILSKTPPVTPISPHFTIFRKMVRFWVDLRRRKKIRFLPTEKQEGAAGASGSERAPPPLLGPGTARRLKKKKKKKTSSSQSSVETEIFHFCLKKVQWHIKESLIKRGLDDPD